MIHIHQLSILRRVAHAVALATPSGHIDPRYYWVLSEGDFDAAHAFVVAPPFYVVDVTLRYQPNLGPYEQLLPTRVVWDTMKGASWSEIDLAQPQLSREIAAFTSFSRYLDEQYPDMVRVTEQRPARSVNTDLVNLKYIPVAVGATRGPLEQLIAYCPCGRTPYEIFTSEILPRADSRT